MGRQTAGEGFLKGFVKHAKVSTLYCYGPDIKQFQRSIAETVTKERYCFFISFENSPRLHEVGCLFVPGPNISNYVWVRRSLNSRAYSWSKVVGKYQELTVGRKL